MDFSELLSELRKQGRTVGRKDHDGKGNPLVEIDGYLLHEGEMKMLAESPSTPTWEWLQKRDEHKAKSRR